MSIVQIQDTKGILAESVGQTIRMLCEWRNIKILKMNIREDHIHLILNITPRLSIFEVMGMLKGTIAIKLFKNYPALKKKPY